MANDMARTSEDKGSVPDQRATRAPRLWPAIVVLMIQACFLAICFTPSIDSFTRFACLMLGPLICGILFAIWLVFGARLGWRHGMLALLFATAVGVATGLCSAPRTGVAYWMYGIPATMLLITVGLMASRSWSSSRRLLSIVVFGSLGWGLLSMLRVEGVDGSYWPQLSWRWQPTAEQRLLSSLVSAGPAALDPPLSSWTPVHVEWPGFRGSARDSRTPGPGQPLDLQATPPRELWRRPVGPAWSSMSIVSDRLFTQEQRGDAEVVACYDANTGAPIWQHTDACRFEEVSSGAGPRATPTYADGRVFAYGATAILVALDAATGAVIWRHDLVAEVGAKVPMWGCSSSPAVVNNLVIVYADGDGPNGWIACDNSSGSIVWTAPGRGMNFSSALLATLDGEPTVVCVDGTRKRTRAARRNRTVAIRDRRGT